MFRHVVMFTWNADASAQDRDAAVRALEEWGRLAVDYGTFSVGVDAGLAEGNGDVAVVVDLPDRERYRAYSADERHKAVIRDWIRPILAGRCAVQYEI